MLRKNRPSRFVSDPGRIGADWNDCGHLLAAEEAVPGLSLIKLSKPRGRSRPVYPALKIKLGMESIILNTFHFELLFLLSFVC